MSYLPCLNPACSSHGKPHPNCQCYNHMAAGGEVKHFCESGMPHQAGCEYYKDGGVVGSTWNPPQDGSEIASVLAHSGAHRLLTDKKLHMNHKSGLKSIDSMIEGIFSNGHADYHKPDKEEREKLKEYMSSGKFIDNPLSEQMMAEGGTPMSNAMNMMVHASKARVHGYLNALRPPEGHGKLIFDDHIKDPDHERSYNRALDIANKPLSVLNHTKKGTLLTEHVGHLNHMYPEVYEHLSKRITDRIMKAKLEGEKPKFQQRQMLSMFMGTDLESIMTPQSIQAAQATFMNAGQPAPQQQPQKSKGNKGKLDKMPQAFRTPEQATEVRQQSAK